MFVPPEARKNIWIPTNKNADKIHLIVLSGDKDYFDAISFARKLCDISKFETEGGARNVARRDGMGTVMLDAVTEIGKLPDYYVQAVGSGTGGIAAYEASLRLQQDGKFGYNLPRLHLVQNLPFIPMVNAWKQNSRELLLDQRDSEAILKDVKIIMASVLANRNPPYSIPGGVYECLQATNGDMSGVNNQEAISAKKFFESTEGIDVVPAAAVAIAGLINIVEEGKIKENEVVLLNITGGGLKRVKEDLQIQHIKPEIVTDDPERAATEIGEISGKTK